jgi:plastocyanin
MREHYSRRRVPAPTGTAGAVALAGCTGCGGGNGVNSGDDTTDAPTESDSGDGESWAQADRVEITDELGHQSARIEVGAGTTGPFETTGNVGHTATAYQDTLPEGAAYFAVGGFDSERAALDADNDDQSGNVSAGETYEYTFETTGAYEYYGIPHEMSGMVGYVTVV